MPSFKFVVDALKSNPLFSHLLREFCYRIINHFERLLAHLKYFGITDNSTQKGRQKTRLLALASIATQPVNMAAVTDKEIDDRVHNMPSPTGRKGQNVFGGQAELESSYQESELASIERVERVYK